MAHNCEGNPHLFAARSGHLPDSEIIGSLLWWGVVAKLLLSSRRDSHAGIIPAVSFPALNVHVPVAAVALSHSGQVRISRDAVDSAPPAVFLRLLITWKKNIWLSYWSSGFVCVLFFFVSCSGSIPNA